MKTRKIRNLCVGILTAFYLLPVQVSGQYCDSVTPTFNVDLSASPNMSWISPVIARDGYCCGATAPDKCLEFVITLNPNSAAIVFNIASGAIPPGALFYQIDCGPATPVGSPICLYGPGPFHLTFCKPGNNANTFSIQTIPNPVFGPDLSLGEGCTDNLWVHFYDETTISWNSIFPGAPGSQNGLLSCTAGCDTVAVTNNPLAPPVVEYLVCGMAANGCSTDPICDTMTVQFTPPLALAIDAPDTVLCPNESTVPATAIVSGGTPPYTFNWSNGTTGSSADLGAGTYTLTVTDASNCAVHQASVTVTQLLPPTVNASPAVDLCVNYVGSVSFSATAANTQGVTWSGGTGTFSPSNTALNVDYTPGPGETAGGSVPITVTSVNNTGCPEVQDGTAVSFNPVLETVLIQTLDVSCFGMTNGAAEVDVQGVNSPYSFSFDGASYSGTNTVGGLAAGTHTVSIRNSLGCDTTINFHINEPPLLQLAQVSTTDVTCFGLSDGAGTVHASGGFGNYYYAWQTSPLQNAASASGLASGTYTVNVSDDNNCAATLTVTINEPAPLTNSFSLSQPLCHGSSDGSLSSMPSGGVPPYSFEWNTGQNTGTINNVSAGGYTVNITDANGCTLSDGTNLNQPPALAMTISNDTVVCPGSTITLFAGANGGTSPYSFSWDSGSGTGAAYSVTPLQNNQYSCDVTDANGCVVSATTAVQVFTLNPADIWATVSDSVICPGGQVNLNGGYTGNDQTVVLSWDFCSGCPVYQEVQPSGSTVYTLSATNQCNEVITASVEVTVDQPPLIVLNPDMGNYCAGEYFSVQNEGANSSLWYYTWNFGDGTVSHDLTGVHSYPDAGVYSVTLTVSDEYGCISTSTSAGTVVVNPLAHADFTVNTQSTTTLDPEFHFTNLSTNANSYQWHFDDGASSVTQNPSHIYSGYGTFTVTLNANNQYNCPDQTQLVVEVKPSFDLYVPNAFTPDGDAYNNVFLAKGYGIQENDFTMEIYNRWGELLFESHDMARGWDGSYKSGADRVQDGTYTWVIRFKDLTNGSHQLTGHVNVLK